MRFSVLRILWYSFLNVSDLKLKFGLSARKTLPVCADCFPKNKVKINTV